MIFSLILATVGRTDELGRFLDSLLAQTQQSFELIIVDQNEDSRILDVIKPFQDLMQIIHLRSAPGLSRARNIGLMNISGDFVAFPDDDCTYPTDLLKIVADWMEINKQFDFITGQYIDFDGTKTYFDSSAGEVSLRNMYRRLSSITCFFRSDAIDGLLFDEDLGSGTSLPAAEELDFTLQLLRRKCRGWYEPDLIVFHKVNRFSTQNQDHIRLREIAKAYMVMKNAMNGNFLLLPIILVRMIRDIVLIPFTREARIRFKLRWKGYSLALKKAYKKGHSIVA